MNIFEVTDNSLDTNGRLGILTTGHGYLETPAYAIVATHGQVRCLDKVKHCSAGLELVIANTYHLWNMLGESGLDTFGGLHAYLGWCNTIMTDSGGFQVFSYGAGREHASGKIFKKKVGKHGVDISKVNILEDGVYFEENGIEKFLNPELSINIQERLAGDIIVAFDEPTSPLHDFDYTLKAVLRTNRWADRCLRVKKSNQIIYGVTQGGPFEELRKLSAAEIGKKYFDGFAIGGCFGESFGSSSEAMKKELEWTLNVLPPQKPRHLLGIGRVRDVIYGVESGIDTFDCVIPTREARHGTLWTVEGKYDIKKAPSADDRSRLSNKCLCEICASGVTKKYLNQMFREKNPRAREMATEHNVYFFNQLMRDIRLALKNKRWADLKNKYADYL